MFDGSCIFAFVAATGGIRLHIYMVQLIQILRSKLSGIQHTSLSWNMVVLSLMRQYLDRSR